MEHLGGTLRKGGVRDLLLFFPQTKRAQANVIESHFKSAEVNLPQVAEYWQKRQQKGLRDQTVARLSEMLQEEEEVPQSQVVEYLKSL